MRTTVTLTSEANALVRKLMRERGLSFKEAVNAAILEGSRPQRSTSPRYSTPTFDLGRGPNLDKAVALAAQLENEALMAKRDLGK